jgi:hypothetical protein
MHQADTAVPLLLVCAASIVQGMFQGSSSRKAYLMGKELLSSFASSWAADRMDHPSSWQPCLNQQQQTPEAVNCVLLQVSVCYAFGVELRGG